MAITGDVAAQAALLSTAEAGDAEAMFFSGLLYDMGRGARVVAMDLDKARSWYEGAAAAGHVLAQFALGNMFDNGEGVPQDPMAARHWYELAARQGHAEAQMHFARMQQLGRGGTRSAAGAAIWYQMAADQGHELAATNLGTLHYQKEIPDPSDAEAFALFSMAAEKFDGLAHLMLAEMWQQGRGTKQENSHALLHYCIASLLLPNGSNRDRAVSVCEVFFAQYPEFQSEFEAKAARYVAERE